MFAGGAYAAERVATPTTLLHGAPEIHAADPSSSPTINWAERRECARAARQYTGKSRAVSENDAGHAVVGDPVYAERRIDFRAIVDGQKSVALQPT